MDVLYRSDFVSFETYRLFVVEHVPASARGRIVLCAPFLEEKQFCRRYLRHLAESLAQMGWHVTRFDSIGEGDSDGELSDISLDDILRCLHSLSSPKKNAEPLVLLGLRWGGTLALLSQSIAADAVIAIEPLIRGEDYVQQLLRQNLVTQMSTWGAVRENREALLQGVANGESVNVQGFELGPRLVEQMRHVVLPDAEPSARVALIKLGNEEDPAPMPWQPHLDRWGATYTSVEGLPFWYEPKYYDAQKNVLTQSVQLQLAEWFQ